MGVTTLFVTGAAMGLVAGGASCAAVQGGLLAGAVSRRRVHGPVDTTGGSAVSRVSPVRLPGGSGAASGARFGTSILGPVAAFLAAKLVSHTALGAVLGILGAMIAFGPRTQAVLLVCAAAAMVVFALDLIGVGAVRRLVPRPPEAWTRRVRRSTRSTSVSAPVVLGLLTVLLPCGVTLSAELLAVTSGSGAGGAAVMAGFVLGTGPLFAVLGVLLHASTRLLQGRLTVLTGTLVLAVAVWTGVSGLRLGGWLGSGGGGVALAASQAVRIEPGGTQSITLQVRDTEYVPAAVTARAGVPTVLVLRTEDTYGCTRALVLVGRDGQHLLPASGQVRIDLGTPRTGTLRYACSMGMYSGRVEFR